MRERPVGRWEVAVDVDVAIVVARMARPPRTIDEGHGDEVAATRHILLLECIVERERRPAGKPVVSVDAPE